MRWVCHVVCHDCPFEGLYEGAEADGVSENHRREYDHRVSHLQIQQPEPS